MAPTRKAAVAAAAAVAASSCSGSGNNGGKKQNLASSGIDGRHGASSISAAGVGSSSASSQALSASCGGPASIAGVGGGNFGKNSPSRTASGSSKRKRDRDRDKDRGKESGAARVGSDSGSSKREPSRLKSHSGEMSQLGTVGGNASKKQRRAASPPPSPPQRGGANASQKDRSASQEQAESSQSVPHPSGVRLAPPSYRWLDFGNVQPDGTVIHDHLEICGIMSTAHLNDSKDHKGSRGRRPSSTVSVGDCVLLCSEEMNEEELIVFSQQKLQELQEKQHQQQLQQQRHIQQQKEKRTRKSLRKDKDVDSSNSSSKSDAPQDHDPDSELVDSDEDDDQEETEDNDDDDEDYDEDGPRPAKPSKRLRPRKVRSSTAKKRRSEASSTLDLSPSSGRLSRSGTPAKPDASTGEETQYYGGDGSIFGGTSDDGAGEDNRIYGASEADILSALDPFVALVEKMWEDPPIDDTHDNKSRKRKSRKDSDDESADDSDTKLDSTDRRMRMKIRARWFFKKEDVAGLGGNFVGVSKRDVLAQMSSRDVVLGNHTDDNEVATILGKCRVLRRRPGLNPAAGSRKDKEGTLGTGRSEPPVPQGASYICKFDINIHVPPPRSNEMGIVAVAPYDGQDDVLFQAERPYVPDATDEDEDDEEEDEDDEVVRDNTKRTGKEEKEALLRNRSDRKVEVESADTIKPKDGEDAATALDGPGQEVATAEPRASLSSASFFQPSSAHKTSQEAQKEEKAVAQELRDNVIPANETGQSIEEQTLHVHKNIQSVEMGLLRTDKTSAGVTIQSSLPSPPKGNLRDGLLAQAQIRIGPNHQVSSLPPAEEAKAYSKRVPSRRAPKVTWKQDAGSDESVNDFLKKVGVVLRDYLRAQEFRDDEKEGSAAPRRLVLIAESGGNSSARGTEEALLPREARIDDLLTVLSENMFDVQKAVEAVGKQPNDFLTLWTTEEQELFDAGFRRYCGTLRMIGKGVGPSKSLRQIVDYYYRFKIPEQYYKFQDQKREQARRMLEVVDDRRAAQDEAADREANESGLATGRAVGGNLGVSGGSKRARNWGISAGGPSNTLGAVEKRREQARSFLRQAHECLSHEMYNELVAWLQSYQTQTVSVLDLREFVLDLLKDQPLLLELFLDFLPRKHRV